MKNLKSHFLFNKQQRSGILFLILFIAGLLGVYHFGNFSQEQLLDTTSAEVMAIRTKIDSLHSVNLASRQPKTYPFNPNYMTDYKAYTLGLSPFEFDRLKAFRDSGNWINSAADFKKVTQVSDSLLDAISPLFKFPAWVNDSEKRGAQFREKDLVLSEAQKIDLNLATLLQLQEVNGIGEVYSKRIIAYREKLGGFTADVQLYQVWGLEANLVQKVLHQFTVKTPKIIDKMNLNIATASDIATIPGISFELAKEIWEYRISQKHIYHFSELEKIEGMTANKLEFIQLYLYLD